MSIFTDARVSLLLADYISPDAAGKVTAVGSAWNVTALDPKSQTTPPQYLQVLIELPRQHVGEAFPLVIELRDLTTDSVAVLKTAAGSESMKISQLVQVEAPTVPAGTRMPEGLACRVTQLLAFHNGLPLIAGHSYRWRVEIEGQSRPQWYCDFHVLEPAAQPLLGGLNNPIDKNLPSLGEDQDDIEVPEA